MSRRNYWHVYNWLRRYYIETGVIVERGDLLAEFADLDPADVDEGIGEFELAIGKRKREAVLDGQKHA
jgi:hypothetical protein